MSIGRLGSECIADRRKLSQLGKVSTFCFTLPPAALASQDEPFVHNGSTPNNSASLATESRAARIIREVFESGRPLTYIRTAEEQRVGKVLREVAARMSTSTPV